MNKEQLKEFLKQQQPTFLQQAPKLDSRRRPTYVCPWCGNGSGQHGTGIEYSEQNGGPHYNCFKCGEGGDVITLWRTQHPEQSFTEALKALADYYHVDMDDSSSRGPLPFRNLDKPQQPQAQATEQTDYTEYFKKCHAAALDSAYLRGRGIGRETIEEFNIGVDPDFRQGTGGRPWNAVIFPTSNYSFNARNTDPNADKGDRFRKSSGTARIFNERALLQAETPIFVVEGEMDALSIHECFGEAVGLGGAGSYRKLADIVKTAKPVQPLIIALDNDDTGKKDAAALAAELDKMQIPYYMPQDESGTYNGAELYGDSKDANEALMKDREGLARALGLARDYTYKRMEDAQEKAEKAAKEEYRKQSAGAHIQDFIDGVKDSVNTPPTPTGFTNLDDAFEGGLYEGLYIVGGLSSLGKTSLVLQIADQIAQQGQDVLIFSLEMARTELMAKTISRHTLLRVVETGEDARDAKTARGITTGARYKNYSKAEIALIKYAEKEYEKYADHIFITEALDAVTVKDIKQEVDRYISVMQAKPVVIIDYIQILAPMDPRATDKANMDTNMRELKHISRDHKIPVIGISSLNRASYNTRISMEAFKESGAIEYSSDVLIGLQFRGTGSPDFDVNAAKRKKPREIEAVILKNRNGQTGIELAYDYYPMFNYFEEA